MLLFTYGSLKKGYGNNALLVREHAEFIGKAVTINRFNMISFGVPGVLIPISDKMLQAAKPVVGELYRISDLREIDILEGHPRLYKRKKIKVELDNGEIVKAWIYILNISVCGKPSEVANQDFVEYMDSSIILTEKGYEWRDMIICPRCWQETDSKYNVCQNCGTTLTGILWW